MDFDLSKTYEKPCALSNSDLCALESNTQSDDLTCKPTDENKGFIFYWNIFDEKDLSLSEKIVLNTIYFLKNKTNIKTITKELIIKYTSEIISSHTTENCIKSLKDKRFISLKNKSFKIINYKKPNGFLYIPNNIIHSSLSLSQKMMLGYIYSFKDFGCYSFISTICNKFNITTRTYYNNLKLFKSLNLLDINKSDSIHRNIIKCNDNINSLNDELISTAKNINKSNNSIDISIDGDNNISGDNNIDGDNNINGNIHIDGDNNLNGDNINGNNIIKGDNNNQYIINITLNIPKGASQKDIENIIKAAINLNINLTKKEH